MRLINMKILIAGGIGITSIIQIIEKVTNDPSDNTKITLIYGNNNSGKILLRQELDIIAEKNANKFRVIYTVDKFEEKWAYEVGYVNDEMIKKYLPPPSKNNFMYICGPPGEYISKLIIILVNRY